MSEAAIYPGAVHAVGKARLFLGIDPGLSGALAWYWPAQMGHPEQLKVEDVPVVGAEIDAVTLANRIRQMSPDFAIIENVHSMPKQGVASSFKFGRAFGCVTGVVQALGVPLKLVAPTVWKKHYALDSDKEKARALAMRYWPRCIGFSRKRDHGRAEAALVAKWGAELAFREAA